MTVNPATSTALPDTTEADAIAEAMSGPDLVWKGRL